MVAGGDGSRRWPGSGSISNIMSACFAPAGPTIWPPQEQSASFSPQLRDPESGGNAVRMRNVPRETPRSGLSLGMLTASSSTAQVADSAPDGVLAVSNGASASATSSSSSVAGAVHHRDYDPVRDAEDLERICKNVYNGRDYLPRVIDLFVDSPVDYPMVLEGLDSRVAALGNVQMLPTGDAWLQAIRVDEEAKGRGMGTEITKVLTFKSFSLGSQRVLSSTTPTNPVMRHIFDKLGFAKYDHSWVWMARPALSARGGGDEPRGLNGADFLEKSGLLAGCEGASVDGFEACGSVERAQAVLKSAGGGKGQYMVGEYRVHSVDQDLGRGAVEEGRCWVKGESTIAMAWKSPELRGGWFLGVVSDSAEDVKGAILLAAKELDAPFSLAFSGDIQAGSVLQGECLEQVGECEYFEKIFDSPRKSVSLEYIYAP